LYYLHMAMLATKPSTGYELLDSGLEEKLERYGDVVLARPDPQALWEKNLPPAEWRKADAWYERAGKVGKWHMKKEMPREWQIEFGGFKFLIRPTTFKHTGLFPEQLPNWEWISERLKPETGNLKPKVLNLFAYTGGASLAAAKAGAEVVHLDASKTAVEWAKENARLSGLSEKPVRWILDDAFQFVKRELKRGNRYDGIIMDPPAFGHGPKDELWKIEEHFLSLMDSCKKLLSDKPLFFLVNGYASGYSHLVFRYNLESVQKQFGGTLESGELGIEESKTGRVLPAGIYGRWSGI
jgi:23S rRNA (cytosine1962-C5)-methyltransferase